MQRVTLKRYLAAGLALLVTLGVLVAWKVSYLSQAQAQLAREQVTITPASPLKPFTNVLAATFLEHREGRIVLVHQVIERPPPPEVELGSDIKLWRVDAGSARRITVSTSHLLFDVQQSQYLVRGAVDPVKHPTSLHERIGFAFRRDGRPQSPLALRVPQQMPGDLFGHPVPSARVTQVMVPHWFLLLVSSAILAGSCRWLWRHRQSRLWTLGGHCGACGYDLRSSRDRCPECGRESSH